MIRRWLLIGLLFLGVVESYAQKIPRKGVPAIHNYTPANYGQAGKAWAIQSAPNGIIYFATDQGLLEFDGHRWVRFAGSKGFTRSLYVASDSTLYTGADKDFGRWQRNQLAQFSFTSLNPFRESTKGLNEEFWGTYPSDDAYVFVSFDNIYLHTPEQLTKISAPSRFYGSCSSGNTIYLFDEKEGLFEFDGLSLLPIANFSSAYPRKPQIIGVHASADTLLIVTRGDGLFRFVNNELLPLNSPVADFLRKDQVFSFTTIEDTHLAFGTILNGVYITDLEGNIIQHINKQKGLLNNTILSVHYSKDGQLWLGMDFGISAIDLWSDMTYFLDQRGQVGTGYVGLLHEEVFYLGTNQGLYYTSWRALDNDASLPNFRLVPGSAGQVWALTAVDGQILCGHDRGLFRVDSTSFEQLHDEAGVLTIGPLGRGQLLTGNYNGISRFEKTNGRWVFQNKIPPVQGAVNQIIALNSQQAWLNLPNFGIIKASLNEDLQITDQRIFRNQSFSGASPLLFQEGGHVKAVTKTSQYQYDAVADTFLTEPKPSDTHQIANGLEGSHLPTMLNEAYRFVPVHNGFALKSTEYEEQASPTPALAIRSVEAFGNDTSQLVSPSAEVPYFLNNLRVFFTLPHRQKVSYQYQLDAPSGTWSAWQQEPYLELFNVAAGRHPLHLRAKIGDEIVAEASVDITIASPWFRTVWAYLIYGLLGLGLLFFNFYWQRRQLARQKERLQVEEQVSQRLQAAATEQQNLRNQYRMLEEALAGIKKQLRSKTIKLARKAKENDEKSRLLQVLKEKVDTMAEGATPSKFQLGQLSRILANYPEEADNSFSIQMEELHQDFLAKLSERFPDLTNYDLRLSAYLKSGLTTREIAELMHVLPSSVNVSRSRLRKKLHLAPKEDLYKFLTSIEVN